MAEHDHEDRPLAPASGKIHSDEEEMTNKLKNISGRRCIKCCGCCTALIVILAVVIIVLTFTLFQVKNPDIKMNSFTITNIKLNGSSLDPTVNITMIADISVKNPNIASFIYKNSTTILYYRGNTVGEVQIPQGQSKARRTQRMNVTGELITAKLISDSNLANDVDSGLLGMSTYTRIGGRDDLAKVYHSDKEINPEEIDDYEIETPVNIVLESESECDDIDEEQERWVRYVQVGIDCLGPEDGYYSTHSSDDEDYVPTTEDLERGNEFEGKLGAKNTLCNAAWVAREVESLVRDIKVMTPKAIKARMKAKYDAKISYCTAWNARQIRMESIVGSYVQGYHDLPSLCVEILKSNSGSITRTWRQDDTMQEEPKQSHGIKVVWYQEQLNILEYLMAHYGEYNMEGGDKNERVLISSTGARWVLNLEEIICKYIEWQLTGMYCIHCKCINPKEAIIEKFFFYHITLLLHMWPHIVVLYIQYLMLHTGPLGRDSSGRASNAGRGMGRTEDVSSASNSSNSGKGRGITKSVSSESNSGRRRGRTMQINHQRFVDEWLSNSVPVEAPQSQERPPLVIPPMPPRTDVPTNPYTRTFKPPRQNWRL
ncbi:hypothetical protein GIB67_027826 [Kingdonia uniflora]|uniref:Late embryogenesis abundant protein LEA-2 subgroup domain-containing protein n=1 Tax=Kingdonia uniflora TaxID=39325 RepID=A0A7J7MI23_9MAGN|nr:hypothetical protein GIB67_027826 [Kingdonia uniflora]